MLLFKVNSFSFFSPSKKFICGFQWLQISNKRLFCDKRFNQPFKMASNHESIAKVYNNIIKSNNDSRLYRGLELVNGLRVMLISDPTTDKSAAALDVRIGFMSDPPDLPGLAHFCEHMLFLGNEKYPNENDYQRFLQQHSGFSNAFTTAENTCFYFDVAPNYLKDALDRFSQFFICPLFTESATEKEVNAVDSEHEKNLQSDTWRLVQLEKSTCNPNHDFSKFGTGTKDTLWNIPKSKGINVRDELLKFHKKYYSSNIMALVVLGKESIEELADIVVPLFSNIPNKNIEIREWKEHPFDSEHLKVQGFVVPVKDLRYLTISFPAPDLQPLYKCNPGHYLSHLIGHEGPGSLLSELKRMGWVNKLAAGYKTAAKGIGVFITNLDLTDEGIDHTDEIVTHFFQYLAMLKAEGPQQWIFDECKNINSMTFHFKDREKPQSYVFTVSGMMFEYPMEEVLSGPYLHDDYEPQHINNLLELLHPNNIRIAVVGKKFEDICTETEQWYGTRYKIKPIPEDILQVWRDAKPHSGCKLPPPNEFIPTNFELFPKDGEVFKYPQLIENNAMSHLWYKQDDEFLLPKSVLTFEIESPVAYLDPLHYNMNKLFVELVSDSLDEYGYAAELAGLAYYLKSTKIGVMIYIKGFNDKQHVLLKKIMERLTNFKIDEKRFHILKEELHRDLVNFRAEQPHRHAVYFTSVLLAERVWTNDELLNCVDELTLESVQQMIPRLLSKVHIDALIHGNVTKQQALSLMNVVESALKQNMSAKYLIPSQLIRDREIQLTDGHHYVYEVVNNVHSCSSVEAYYQCGVQETRSNMLLELLVELLSEPCFNFLRTQEQLGYIVCSGIRRSSCAQGMRILVQSDKAPSYVDGRIEAFVQFCDKYIQDLSQEEYQNHIQSLSTLRLEKPKKLHLQTAKYWAEIVSRQYHFDRDNVEVTTLQTITKDELYSFFKELIAYDAPKRKKLSVHVKSASCKSLNEAHEDTVFAHSPDVKDGLIPPPPAFRPPEKIENVLAFKYSLGLYPLVPSRICIPPPPGIIHEKSKL